MTEQIRTQVELLKKYGVTNYTIENGKITINGPLDLSSLKTADKDFLSGTTINGWLNLSSLKTADKGFLSGTTINGPLHLISLKVADKGFLSGTTINGPVYLNSIKVADKDFLSGTIINGSLYLSSLKTADKEFLFDTTINGWLDLSSLKTADKGFLSGTTINGPVYLNSLENEDTVRKNVRRLTIGHNKEKGYCFFDGILSKVLKVSQKKDYVIYTSPFGIIVQKGEYTAHGKTVKKAIQDVEFKIIVKKLRHDPIKEDTEFTVKYYRLLTGACDIGCRDWMTNNEIPFTIIDGETVEVKPVKAKDLLPLLEKSNAYGVEKFKRLLTF